MNKEKAARALARRAAAEVTSDNLAAIVEENWKPGELYKDGFEDEYCRELLDKAPETDGMTDEQREAFLAEVAQRAKNILPFLIETAKAEYTAWQEDFKKRLQQFAENGELFPDEVGKEPVSGGESGNEVRPGRTLSGGKVGKSKNTSTRSPRIA